MWKGQEFAATVVTDDLRLELGAHSDDPDLVSAVLDTVANLVVILDAAGRIVRFNAACERATGYLASEVIGTSVFDTFVPADERASVRAVFERLRAGDFPNRHRNRWLTKDGSVRLFEWANTCVIGERGDVKYVVGTATDITDRERQEQAQREGEQVARRRADELQAVLDAVPAAVFITRDREARTMDANRFCAEMLRVLPRSNVSKSAEESALPRNFRALKDGGEVPPESLPVQRAARGETVRDYEFDLVFEDGEVRHLFGNAAPLTGPDGAPAGAVGAFVDITRHKDAEETARAEQEKYRSLFEHSLDAVYLTRSDGSILDANPAACRMHGMTVEEIRAAGRGGLVVNDDRHAAALRQRAREGQVRAEFTDRRKDGTTFPVEIESVLLDPSRPDSNAFVIARDITERRRAEQAVRESEARLRVAVEAGKMGLFEMDLVREQVVTSPLTEQLFGYDPADAGSGPHPNARYFRRVHLEDLARVEAAIRASVDEAREHEVEYRVVHPDGRIAWLLSRAGVARDAGGRVTRLHGAVLDITARRAAEDAARDADQRKTAFLGVLSHELRNPLAPIRNSIYLLERAAPDSDQASRAKEIIRRQTEHLARLVDDLLDVTRISHGKIALQRTRVDFREVVWKAADDLRSLFAQANVELRVDHVLGPIWIFADPTRMSQVLGNLLQNAVKFTPGAGVVTVTLAATESIAELRVRDTGIGMEPPTVERMFEPFAQADHSLARTKGGLGLGLALVRGLVELHGGTVQARSEGTGRGAEFIVRIPIANPAAASVTPAAGGTRVEAQDILIIEDNLDAGDVLADILEMEGHRVRVARDGRSGLALARAFRPAVVLCDIGLPDLDGYAVARAVRTDEALRSTRLIALSGYGQPEDRQRALEAGFDAHVVKPPDPEALMRVLAGAPPDRAS